MPHILFIIIWVLVGLSGLRVFYRAGFKGYIGFLFFIPVINLFALLYLAYMDWPKKSDRKNG